MPLVHISDEVVAVLGVSAHWASAAFADFARAAAPAAVAALWQGLLVALSMILCLRLLLRASAAHRFAAWAAGFAIAALLPLLPFAERLFESSGVPIATAPMGGAAAKSWFELDSRWGLAIAALWLAVSIFRAGELASDLLRLRRLWRGATLVETDGLRPLLAAAWPARTIQVCITPDLDRPSVIGFFAPRILIPDWLYPRLTSGELEQVVLHEAEHLRRRDDWTNLLQKLSLVLFPLNPALAWMELRLCREREMACDEGVIERTQAPRSYAACLTTLAEREFERRSFLRRAQALSLGAFERRPELAARVHSILRRRPSLHPLAAGALVGVLGCGLLVGAVELSRSPQIIAFVAVPAPEPPGAVVAASPRGSLELPRVSFTRNIQETTIPANSAATHVTFHSSEHLREVATSAILPASGKIVAKPPRSRETPGEAAETAMTAPAARVREVPVNAETSTSAGMLPQGQEFVVLTAWEELRTATPRARTVADYDTGSETQDQPESADGQPDQSVQRGQEGGAQITVTQLVLLVGPANTASGSPAAADPDTKSGTKAGTTPRPDTRSNAKTGMKPARIPSSHRPIAIDGGWLFFQL